MKIGIYVCLIFIVVSCSNSENRNKITGKYKSKTYHIFQRIIMQIKNENHVLGSELDLRADSSYLYISCGNIMNGHWKIQNKDTLALFCINNRFRNDSLNEAIGATCGTSPVKYKILNNGELKREFILPQLNKNCIDAFVKK